MSEHEQRHREGGQQERWVAVGEHKDIFVTRPSLFLFSAVHLLLLFVLFSVIPRLVKMEIFTIMKKNQVLLLQVSVSVLASSPPFFSFLFFLFFFSSRHFSSILFSPSLLFILSCVTHSAFSRSLFFVL